MTVKDFRIFLFLILFASFLTAQDKPKNIIILIGDGMGLNHVALEFLKDSDSPYFSFPFTGLSVTTSADKLITDSAAGATAIATGSKTKNGYVGVDSTGAPLRTLFEAAKDRKKSTGLVILSTLTHATPGAFYAHNKSRNRQAEIALDYVQAQIDIAIGSGSSYFYPANLGGRREDNRNLLDELAQGGYSVIKGFDSDAIIKNHNKRTVVFLDTAEVSYAPERGYTLGQLTGAALGKLSLDKDGFVLMVEGSQIDWAAHDKDTVNIYTEMADFTTAVQTALEFAKKDKNTLVIITADHETGGLAINKGRLNDSVYTLAYTSGSHTAGAVPVFAFGPGAKYFTGLYHNDVLGKRLMRLINK